MRKLLFIFLLLSQFAKGQIVFDPNATHISFNAGPPVTIDTIPLTESDMATEQVLWSLLK